MLAGALLLAAAPAMAQDWGRRGWETYPRASRGETMRREERDGGRTPARKVDVATFVADTALAATLGQGSIEVLPVIDGEAGSAVFEAAVADRLIAAGYDTTAPTGRSGQVTELRIVRRELPSDARPQKPVSGEMAVEVGSYGTSVGLALDIDLSKPRGPLVATRLEARIRDRASNELLWEGRAEVVARQDGEGGAGEDVAARLAKALFAGFPDPV